MSRFLEALKSGPLVVDGAMGTQLYERGILFTVNYEELNLSRPDLVRRILEEYLRAGAQIVETNTFGANPARLARHGLEGRVHEINVAGVARAREAVANVGLGPDAAFVGGAIGPTGLMFPVAANWTDAEKRKVVDGFRAQADALAEAGADLLIIETMRQPEELALALDAAKRTGLPVVAQASFDEGGTMADGTTPEAIAKLLVDLGADVVGANCGEGPKLLFEIAERMLAAFPAGQAPPVSAVPNAGLPRRIDDRTVYMATPEYFQLYARRMFKLGVTLVGGCCGTTPDHIKKIAAAARMVGGDRAEIAEGRSESDRPEAKGPIVAPGITVTRSEEKTKFSAAIHDPTRFVVSVEVNPPPGLSIKKALDAAKMLAGGGVDVINVADGPRASARMSNLALVHRIQEQVGCEALLHVCCRDRNLLGTVGHLLAAHELDVHNLVVITGDPPKMGDFPDATGVFDLDSVALLRLITNLNRGFDPGGKPMGGATRFFCATGAEPAALNYEREMTRLEAKRRAGAELVMTQPVYDLDILDRFLKDAAPLGLPILVGLLPLASHRNAEFLHNEVPGMQIPESVRERMRKVGSGAPARREGVAIAREMLAAIKDRPLVRGAYIMPPLERYETALEVIQGIVR
ncbi:MAG: bifunctional homocysteine S-methyltransferase/methylenetetrahydrofolate reductase [Deltaproteobacteria bacterium]|nr:bifunctional homocysteine S-methyltransferase/methylenetetrahydrofolate reductase [Deltaproteobacteria bacterium]